jgi:hypothetical protein
MPDLGRSHVQQSGGLYDSRMGYNRGIRASSLSMFEFPSSAVLQSFNLYLLLSIS